MSHIYWVIIQNIEISVLLVNHFTPLYFLTGPAIYFYIKSILKGNFTFKKKNLFHLIPFIIQFIAISGYLFTPLAEKKEILTLLLKDPQNALRLKFNFFFNPTGNFFFRLLSVFVYIGLSFRVIILNRQHYKAYRRTFLWLGALLFSFLLLVLSYSIFISQVFSSPGKLFHLVTGNISIISLISLSFISFLPLLFPHIIYGKIAVKGINKDEIKMYDAALEALPNKKTVELFNKIDSYFINKEPYLEPYFTLPQLAKKMKVPVHHLQKAFKEVGKTTFVKYKTRHKVQWAKNALVNPLFKNDTIDTVGMYSGFNSKSQFYAAFRKFEKMTPREYSLKNK